MLQDLKGLFWAFAMQWYRMLRPIEGLFFSKEACSTPVQAAVKAHMLSVTASLEKQRSTFVELPRCTRVKKGFRSGYLHLKISKSLRSARHSALYGFKLKKGRAQG